MAGANRLSCFGARYKGICNNGLTIRRDEVEARVLQAPQEKLLNQEVLFNEFCEESTREMNRLRMQHRANLIAAEPESSGSRFAAGSRSSPSWEAFQPVRSRTS
jgi:hypothetical protein